MKFYANPYDITAQGFYFETYEEYEAKVKSLRNSSGLPVEEFEIDVIDGSSEEITLVNATGLNQYNLKEVIEYIDEGNESEWPAIFFLLDNGHVRNLEEAKNKVDEVCITESSLLDAASELFDDCYLSEIPKSSRNFIGRYIDYDAFANDCKLGGDMAEFEFGGKTYTCTNANGI